LNSELNNTIKKITLETHYRKLKHPHENKLIYHTHFTINIELSKIQKGIEGKSNYNENKQTKKHKITEKMKYNPTPLLRIEALTQNPFKKKINLKNLLSSNGERRRSKRNRISCRQVH